MGTLVKGGRGRTVSRGGSWLDDELTTRPIAGMDWTVDTAVIYHKLRHPKTVPILVRKFGRQVPQNAKESKPHKVSILVDIPKRPPQPTTGDPAQLTFFREAHEQQRNGTG